MTAPQPGGDPEVLLQQALRAMAGGRREEPAALPAGGHASGRSLLRWSVTQILLLAAIVGLVAGMAAAFIVLLVR